MKDTQQIFISQGGEAHGPFPREEVAKMLKSGSVSFEDSAWSEGMDDWRRLADFFESSDFTEESGFSSKIEPIKEVFLESFPVEVIRSFVYPFRGSGSIVLIAGSTAYTLGYLIFWVPIFGWAFYILATAYFVAYLLDVMRSSAIEENELPMFPGIDFFWDDVFVPALRVCVIFFFYLSPGFAAFQYFQNEPEIEQEIARILIIMGLALVPMALLRVAVLNTVISGMNVFAVILGVFRLPFAYFITLGLLYLLYIAWIHVGEKFSELPWFLGLPAIVLFVFYILTVKARLIGVIYKRKKDILSWIG